MTLRIYRYGAELVLLGCGGTEATMKLKGHLVQFSTKDVARGH